MLAEIGVRVPDATPISLLLKTKPIKTDLRAVLNTPHVAVRPTLDGALVLDSAWSEEEVVVNSDGTYTVHDKTVKGLLEEASAVLDVHDGHVELRSARKERGAEADRPGADNPARRIARL